MLARLGLFGDFPDNLACYPCQPSDLIGSRDWLAQAYKLGDADKWKLTAMQDPDLAPLWEGDESDARSQC